MKRCLEAAAARYVLELDGKRHLARVEAKIERDYDRMDVPESAPIVQLVHAAAKNLRLEVKTLATGGGCDANVLNQKGLVVANLSHRHARNPHGQRMARSERSLSIGADGAGDCQTQRGRNSK